MRANLPITDAAVVTWSQVEAKKAVPKEDQPPSSGEGGPSSSVGGGGSGAASAAGSKGRKVFVGGLAASVDDAMLREYFEAYGEVEDAVVMYDHDNKRPRGFGFVTFANEESVGAAFAAGHMQSIANKQIEIKSAVPRDQMPATGGRGGLDLRFGGGRGAPAGYAAVPQGPMGPMGRGFQHPHGIGRGSYIPTAVPSYAGRGPGGRGPGYGPPVGYGASGSGPGGRGSGMGMGGGPDAAKSGMMASMGGYGGGGAAGLYGSGGFGGGGYDNAALAYSTLASLQVRRGGRVLCLGASHAHQAPLTHMAGRFTSLLMRSPPDRQTEL
eukprot:359359-Chlamydomonas_euryale.AAC.2